MKIPEHSYTPREQTVADILKNTDLKKGILNVGFHDWQDPRRHWWIKICEANGLAWRITEIFQPNVDDALLKGCPPDKISLGDILDLKDNRGMDCLLFWHGPEHLPKEDMLAVLPELEKLFPVVIMGMPLGEEPQGEAYGNPHERHISVWHREDWAVLGYEVIEVHDRQRYPHMTVYKFTGSKL